MGFHWGLLPLLDDGDVSGVQEEIPVALEIDLSKMPVEDDYKGPMMEGGATVSFMTCMHACLPACF